MAAKICGIDMTTPLISSAYSVKCRLKASKSSKVFKPNRSESLQTVNFSRDQGSLAPLASVVRLMPSKEDKSLQQCVTVRERMR